MPATDHPNILLFFTDDQRYDTIAALGNSEIHTPHLDRLVAGGTTFTRAHIPGGTSGAVCMPSRAMLHSGRTLFHLDGQGQTIPEQHRTLGECLREHSYDTFATGKWHNEREAFARGFNAGADIFFGGMDDHWNVPVYDFDPGGGYRQRLPCCPDPFRSNRVVQRQGDRIHAGRHSTDLFVDAAIRFLDQRNAANPFFMYVSLMAPHDPRSMPERFRTLYDPAAIELPASFVPNHPIDTGALRIRDEMLAAFPRDADEIRRQIAEYYAMITHLDDGFGRLMDALERSGQRDRTLVIVAGDNGLAVGRHGLMGKQNLYDHSVRVPLIFSGPGIPRGAQSDALVYLLDVYPTLCGLLGFEAPASVEGINCAPCLAEPGRPGRDVLYLAYCDTIRGVTDGRWKLIEYAAGDTQLFDLANDPGECRNLAGDPGAAAVLREKRAQLKTLAAAWDDAAHPLGARFLDARPDLFSP